MEYSHVFFRQWWAYFTDEDELMEDYKMFCSTGSTKSEKIRGRLAVMVKSFCAYHEIEIPEELKDMVAETEEKISAVKKENVESPDFDEAESLLEEKEDSGEPAENAGQEEAIIEDSVSEDGDAPTDAFSEQDDNADNHEDAGTGEDNSSVDEEENPPADAE